VHREQCVSGRLEQQPLNFGLIGGNQQENEMTVNTGNRSHRIVYLVVLLMLAVALTTALVLAGELKPEGTKASTLQSNTVPVDRAVWLWGNGHA
jgi:hypothetical protein